MSTFLNMNLDDLNPFGGGSQHKIIKRPDTPASREATQAQREVSKYLKGEKEPDTLQRFTCDNPSCRVVNCISMSCAGQVLTGGVTVTEMFMAPVDFFPIFGNKSLSVEQFRTLFGRDILDSDFADL